MATLASQDKRTNYCGNLRKSDIGTRQCVMGWVARVRDLGSLIFIDLRDRTGIVQLAFDENTDKAVFEAARSTRAEYVIVAHGNVRQRSSINETIPTGFIEIEVDEYKILSEAQTTPFEINENADNVRDELKLKYRYLDLRRQILQQNILVRHNIAKVTRDYFYENDFIEIETPMMIKPTPEGARDYVVPSRIHNGCVYALPQSPQIYKQLLMVSGFDRYIQLARCFRDEDLRADRQPEFTQIDLEMSFVNQEDIMNMMEGYVVRLFKEILGVELQQPIPRLKFAEAMSRFGSDKPDTRFAMEIQDVSDIVKNSPFAVFAGAVAAGGSVRAIVAKGGAQKLTRKEIDKLTEHAKGIGAKGLAYIRYVDEKPTCSFAKFLGEGELEAIMERIDCKRGDVALIVADKDKVTLPTLGALRLIVAKQLGIIPEKQYNFVWITEFPFFEQDEETGAWVAMHHPFTMPLDECLEYIDTDPGKVRAKCYDLVLNGVEISSGSIRITDPVLQQKMFVSLGMEKEEIERKFGFLVDAYNYGAPPHGGAALGLDRLALIMCGAPSLRDVVAFQKVQNASEIMSGCPAPFEGKALEELGLALKETKE
ncbi:MAG: aspartate--tRNA ligase [Clostridia bacterium]|nr:aspartate--tRNA ligase [Clostridia bacterium]